MVDKKNVSELDKELKALNKKFKDMDIKFSGVWKTIEGQIEQSIRDIDGLNNELGSTLADISSILLKGGMSELLSSGKLDGFFAPIVSAGNDFLGIIPSSPSKKGGSKDIGFGESSSQIFSDLSSALSKISRNF